MTTIDDFRQLLLSRAVMLERESKTNIPGTAAIAAINERLAAQAETIRSVLSLLDSVTEPAAPPLDAAELRRWAVEQAIAMTEPSFGNGMVLVVTDLADKFIAYVIGEQTP